MERDEYYSFKKAGAVPFKWEIRPGIPKIHDPVVNPNPRKLKPPPHGLYFQPPSGPRTWALSSDRVGSPGLARPEVVSSSGCFPSPLKKRKNARKKRTVEPRFGSGSEPEYYSDLDTKSRWSVSSRNSVSPLLSTPFASYQSSPRAVSDADWAAFGLF